MDANEDGARGYTPLYRAAEKSLARPGMKQARKHVRDARGFNNVETRAVIKFFFPASQGTEGNSRHSGRNISLFPSCLGLRTYQHTCTVVVLTIFLPVSTIPKRVASHFAHSVSVVTTT